MLADVIEDMVTVCWTGYEGERCQLLVDHCLSQPCKNEATCFSSLAGPRCYCPEGRIPVELIYSVWVEGYKYKHAHTWLPLRHCKTL